MTQFNSRIRDRRGPDSGFTLVELLVVITILGILAAVVVFSVSGLGDKGKATAATADSSIIRTAQEAYCAKNGTYATMDQLVSGKFLHEASTYTDVHLSPVPVDGSGSNGCGKSGYYLTAAVAQSQYPMTIPDPITGQPQVNPSTGNVWKLNEAPKRIASVKNFSLDVGPLLALGARPDATTGPKIVGGTAQDPPAAGDTYGNVLTQSVTVADGAGGTVQAGIDNAFLTYAPAASWSNYVSIGTSLNSTSIAKLATLPGGPPDLIVANNLTDPVGQRVLLDQLLAIAPVVIVNRWTPPTGVGIQRNDWYPYLAQLAGVLDKQQEMADFIGEFETIGNSVIPKLQGKTVTIASGAIIGGSSWFLMHGPCYHMGRFFNYAGLTVQEPDFNGYAAYDTCSGKLSFANTDKVKSDYILPVVAVGSMKSATDQFLDLSYNPLLQDTAAYKATPSCPPGWTAACRTHIVTTYGPSFGPMTGDDDGVLDYEHPRKWSVQTMLGQLKALPCLPAAFGVAPQAGDPPCV